MEHRIYIVRHGQTELNQARRLQGRSDLPLNGAGAAQARLLRDRFAAHGIHIDEIYSSPLKRAVETARIAAGEDVPLITDEALMEMDYGPYEGTDLTSPPPEIRTFFSDFVHQPAPEGMEPLDHVVARMGGFLEELAERLRSGGTGEGRSIMISTHAIAMKGALEYLSPASGGAYWSRHIANCDVYVTELTDEGFSLPREALPIEIVRSENLAHRAAAFYVRMRAMAVKYHIPPELEVDERDGDEDTGYIIAMDGVTPVATCRMFPGSGWSGEADPVEPGPAESEPAREEPPQSDPARKEPPQKKEMIFGRLVVLPGYRGRGLGSRVLAAAEDWSRELGAERVALEAIEDKQPFYLKQGYSVAGDGTFFREPFTCVLMEKSLTEQPDKTRSTDEKQHDE